MDIPPFLESEKCINLRKRSKLGGVLSKNEHKFCEKMFYKYGEWYSKTEARIFNETVPFGSLARIKET